MIHRRDLLKAGVAGAAALATAGCARPDKAPLQTRMPDLPRSVPPWDALARSLPEEGDLRGEVVGRIPESLRGTLYRNGPGLFERDGLRKRSILDGDGMIRCWDVGPDGVRFRNRFTRTEKYVAEEESGRFEYASWTTQAPGGRLANLFATNMGNQAGVSTHTIGGKLYAFDESSPPYEVDPRSLETLGVSQMGTPADVPVVCSAHPRVDASTGEWVLFGLGYGRNVTIHLYTFGPDGSFRGHRALPLPRYAYVHDFFVTKGHVVFNVHAMEISIFDFLLGRTSLVGAFHWKPEQENLFWVVPRDASQDPYTVAQPSHWMWHGVNAWEQGQELVLDYVGYDEPVNFLGEDPGLFSVMEGREGRSSPGTLRRTILDTRARSARSEVLSSGNHEFPVVAPIRSARAHRYAYAVRGREDGLFWSSLVRIDARTGAEVSYDFGPGRICTEPVFAPTPGGDEAAGYLMSEVLDAKTRRSYLAILRADALQDGPVAEVWLPHHLPLSFHGSWLPS